MDTMPYNPQMNGAVERLNQTILAKAKPLLHESGVAEKWWPEIFRTANYLRVRSPVTGKDITPFEAHIGYPPQIDHLPVLGSKGMAFVTKPKTKLAKNSVPGILVGYEGDRIYSCLQYFHYKATHLIQLLGNHDL